MEVPSDAAGFVRRGLRGLGITPTGALYANLGVPGLYEHALRQGGASLSAAGALSVVTGEHTGRSPKDKFVVREPAADGVWWGEVNQPLAPDAFAAIRARITATLGDGDLFVQDLVAGADPEHRLRVRLVTGSAWHALFARTLFIVPDGAATEFGEEAAPNFTILHAPGLRLDPERDGSHSPVAIVTSFGRREILIAGTGYAGEIKKAIFGVLQYLLPRRDIATMHCSANVGPEGDVALFFGLSGTGKTTLSTDPTRRQIGDDEHGWGDAGIFNFEGGSYAKLIRLSREDEPLIWGAMRFGAVMENVILDPDTREPRYDDDALTENTRGAYPLTFIANVVESGVGGHPAAILFLTADAEGVLPPLAALTPEQAEYHFLSGYTSKVAGTERGLGSEPEATFSTCFGSPFLPLPPHVYGDLLAARVARHGARCYLVNTGWTGGPAGIGGRMRLDYTRALVNAAIDGRLDGVAHATDPVFGLRVPTHCPGVPDDLLQPRRTWADGDAYDRRARALAAKFVANFEQYAEGVSEAVRAAGPRAD